MVSKFSQVQTPEIWRSRQAQSQAPGIQIWCLTGDPTPMPVCFKLLHYHIHYISKYLELLKLRTLVKCLGRILGIISENPSVSKSNW